MVSGCAAEVLKKRKHEEELRKNAALRGLTLTESQLRPAKNPAYVYYTPARHSDVFNNHRRRRKWQLNHHHHRPNNEGRTFTSIYRRRNDISLILGENIKESEIRSQIIFMNPKNKKLYSATKLRRELNLEEKDRERRATTIEEVEQHSHQGPDEKSSINSAAVSSPLVRKRTKSINLNDIKDQCNIFQKLINFVFPFSVWRRKRLKRIQDLTLENFDQIQLSSLFHTDLIAPLAQVEDDFLI